MHLSGWRWREDGREKGLVMTVESIMSCRTLWKIIFTGMVCSQRHDRGFFLYLRRAVYQLQHKCMIRVMRYGYLSVDSLSLKVHMDDKKERTGRVKQSELNSFSHHDHIHYIASPIFPSIITVKCAHMTRCEVRLICLQLKGTLRPFKWDLISILTRRVKKKHAI